MFWESWSRSTAMSFGRRLCHRRGPSALMKFTAAKTLCDRGNRRFSRKRVVPYYYHLNYEKFAQRERRLRVTCVARLFFCCRKRGGGLYNNNMRYRYIFHFYFYFFRILLVRSLQRAHNVYTAPPRVG